MVTQWMMQSKGTCWFHCIMNGFLASKYGRRLLKSRVNKYYNDLPPLQKTLFKDKKFDGWSHPDALFGIYKFIHEFMQGSIWSYHMRDYVFIQKFGFGFKNLYGSYVEEAQSKIYKKLGIRFSNDISLRTNADIITLDATRFNRFPLTLGKYHLDHCVISFGAHVVCGVRLPDDTYYVIDSNEFFNVIGLFQDNTPKEILVIYYIIIAYFKL